MCSTNWCGDLWANEQQRLPTDVNSMYKLLSVYKLFCLFCWGFFFLEGGGGGGREG